NGPRTARTVSTPRTVSGGHAASAVSWVRSASAPARPLAIYASGHGTRDRRCDAESAGPQRRRAKRGADQAPGRLTVRPNVAVVPDTLARSTESRSDLRRRGRLRLVPCERERGLCSDARCHARAGAGDPAPPRSTFRCTGSTGEYARSAGTRPEFDNGLPFL